MRILIEVIEARGSAPREAGAWMAVGPEDAEGTIGGGRLEWEAMAAARAMLAAGETGRDMDVALGPEIGQCCGGRVRLRLTAVGSGAVEARRAAEAAALPQVWVFGAGHVGAALARALAALPVRATVVDGRAEALAALGWRPAPPAGDASGGGREATARVGPEREGRRPHPDPLPQGGRGGASGAGGDGIGGVAPAAEISPAHPPAEEGRGEGGALAAGISPALPPAGGDRGEGGAGFAPAARVSPPLPLAGEGWGEGGAGGGGGAPAAGISPALPKAGEGRDKGLPGGGVTTLLTALPEAAIRAAAPGAAFVIATHDHGLDFLLAAEALARGDAAYVGMIGSATKRATFERFARARGVDPGLLVCPIGGPSGDKRPAVIAALTAAEVMRALTGRQMAGGGEPDLEPR